MRKYQNIQSENLLPRQKKSFELKFNHCLKCIEICILDCEGMFPLIVKIPNAEKLYRINKTKKGGLIMSAI